MRPAGRGRRAPWAAAASTRRRACARSAGEFFAKWNARCPPDLFLREAEGLEALRAAGSEIVVPPSSRRAAPAGSDPAFLILEYLRRPRAAARSDEWLGAAWRPSTAAAPTRFGFPSPSYCGTTRQDNRECDAWVEFYRDRRLVPLLDALDAAGRGSPRPIEVSTSG